MRDANEDDRETVTAIPRVLVSYDASQRWRRERTMVNHYLFGRTVTAQLKGRRKKYHYPGLISKRGVERLGQSVFMMREEDADEFTALLKKLGVLYTRERIWVEG